MFKRLLKTCIVSFLLSNGISAQGYVDYGLTTQAKCRNDPEQSWDHWQ
jgi:hypothetical protein